ncbi:MAG: tetratricopeptide repeat protein, partial [Leptospiraceae bacterium]|nr:tetratricopeptide repeat protein [Leptospiraceae bacterium]
MIRKTKLIYLLISFLLLSCSMFQKKKVFESYSVQKDSIVIKDRKNYKKARKYLSIGNRYFQEKNYEKSREYANKAIGLYPDGPSYYLLGINEFEQKKFDKALEAFGKAKDLSPNSEQIRLSYAYCLTSLGKSEEALKEYNKLQKDFPSEPIYPFKAGVLLKELGKNEEAYKTFLSVKAESFSERSQLYMHLGDVCLQLKKYKQADEYFLKAKKENPDLKQVSNSLSASKRAGLIEKGNESLKRKDYDTAIHYFEEAAKKSKEPSIPYLLIANTYLLKEDYSKAEANALRSLKYNPKNRETYLSLASAYSGNGLYSKAIQTLKEALQKTPEHASVYNSLGLAYQNIGQNKQAMLAFLKVKELDPSSQSAYINTGNLFLLEGRYLEARKEYLQAKKLKGKDNADKYLQICDIYIILDAGDTQLRQGNFNKALQEYNKALQLDKGENIIYNAFGRAFFLMNRYKESEKNFLKALSLQADSIPSLQGLVRLYAKTRNPRFSEYKEKLNVLAGKDPLAAIAIGRIYEDEGKLEEAETFYLSILEEAKKKKQNAEAIHYRLGTLYYKMALRENSLKNYDSALGFLSKAEKNNPDIPELAQTRRIIEENKSFLSILPIIEEANEHFNKEDYETAMHHYEKAYKQMKRTSLIIKIADCLIGLGRNEKALALLNHELQKNPESKIELQEAI